MATTKRIKAFTLSELLVVMLITVIVVGLAFTVLRLVQKQLFAIQNNYSTNTALNRLEASLYIDFNRYSDVRYSVKDDALILKHELDSVRYQFTEHSIIKAQDTFAIPLQRKQLYFEGEPSETIVDAIKLTTSKDLRSQELFIFKHNAAESVMDTWKD